MAALPVAAQKNPVPPTAEVQALLLAAQKAEKAGKYEEALGLYTQALVKAQEKKDRTGEAYALSGQGYTYNTASRWQESLKAYQKAVPLLKEIGAERTAAHALGNLGIAYRKLGRFEEAMACYREVLPLYEVHDDKLGQGATLVNIGSLFSALGRKQEASDSLQKALKVLHEIDDQNSETGALAKKFKANALSALGSVCEESGKGQDASDYHKQALEIYQAIHDTGGEARSLQHMGLAQNSLGNWQIALTFYSQALSRYQTIGDTAGEAAVLQNIGLSYEDACEWQKAQEFYSNSLSLYQKVGDTFNESELLDDLGGAYRYLHQPAQSLKFYGQALELRKKLGDQRRIGGTLINMGAVLYEMGRTEEARKNYEEALPLVQAAGERGFEAHALLHSAYILIETGQVQSGMGYLQRAEVLFRGLNDKADLANVFENMGRVEAGQDKWAAAALHFDQAINLTEELRTRFGSYSDAKSNYLRSHLAVYGGAIQCALHLHHEAQAFAFAQQTKARLLLDLSAAGRVDLSRDLTPEERRQEQELRERADFFNQQMFQEGHASDKQRYERLQKQLQEAESRLEIFTDTLYARHPAPANKPTAKIATLDEIGQALPADTALLEYVVSSSEGLTLFVVRNLAGKATLQVFSLPLPYDRLVQEAGAFRAACADPTHPYQPLARSLYQKLLAPAAGALQDARRLIICPDRALWDVPFAALLIGDSRQFVNDRYELAYAYSAAGLLAARALPANRPLSRRTLMVMANPEMGDTTRFRALVEGSRGGGSLPRPFDLTTPDAGKTLPARPVEPPRSGTNELDALLRGNSLVTLHGAQQEAEALKKLFPDAAIYTGVQAQESLFKQQAGPFRYLHFATHGFCNDTAPMLSCLLLAQPPRESHEDGLLTAREISEMDLHADLVTLSACDTARGEERSGEGVIGLSWALLVAGCPTEVVSQWRIDDVCTATLMADFYTRLKAGDGKAAALQQAASKLSRDGKHAHPYYWAPFCLIGDWR